MNGEELIEKREKLGAFAKGLGLKSSSQISSATYIYSRVDGFSPLKEDFEYEKGFGVLSPSILHTLPMILKDIELKEYGDYPEEKEKGELLREYDELPKIASYLFFKEEWDRRKFNDTITKIISNRSKIEEEIEEIREKL